METTNEKLERMEVRVDGEGEPHTERVRKQTKGDLQTLTTHYPPVDWT